ncbi:MAG: hypothetical protein JHC33_09595 [Ignisphaera sp.]|nr:hypothetical protein [Ignisphaera sp.]
METTFDYKASQIAAPDLSAAINDQSKALLADLATKTQQGAATLNIQADTLATKELSVATNKSKKEQLTAEQSLKEQERIAAQHLATQTKINSYVDTFNGKKVADDFEKSLVGLSGAQKEQAYTKHMSELGQLFNEGKITESFHQSSTGVLSKNLEKASMQAQQDTNRNTAAMASNIGSSLDTPEKVNDFINTAKANGASYETLQQLPTIIATAKLNDHNQSAIDHPNATIAQLQEYKANAVVSAKQIEDQIAALPNTPENAPIIAQLKGNLNDTLKGLDKHISDKAGTELALATGDGTLKGAYLGQPTFETFVAANNGNTGAAIKDFQTFSTNKKVADDARFAIDNRDKMSPIEIERLSGKSKEFKQELSKSVLPEMDKAATSGNIEKLNNLALHYPSVAQDYGKAINQISSDHSSYSDAATASANRPVMNQVLDTYSRIYNGPNGVAAAKTMFGNNNDRLRDLSFIKEHVTSGDSIEAMKKLDYMDKNGKVTLTSKSDAMVEFEKQSVGNPNAASLKKVIEVVNSTKTGGATEEDVKQIFNNYNSNVITDEATGISLHSTGGSFVRGTESQVLGYLKGLAPTTTHIEATKHEVILYDANGPQKVVNKEALEKITANTINLNLDIAARDLQQGSVQNPNPTFFNTTKRGTTSDVKTYGGKTPEEFQYQALRNEAQLLRLPENSDNIYKELNAHQADKLDLLADEYAYMKLGKKVLTVNGVTQEIK